VFSAAKEIALESAEGAKKMDAFVRSQYGNEKQKMTETKTTRLKNSVVVAQLNGRPGATAGLIQHTQTFISHTRSQS
jgi:hypothetical protein